jgi:hypothetical protein
MYIGCYSDEPFQLKKDYVPFSDSSINQKRRTSLYNTKTQVDHFLFFIQGEKITYEEWKREHSVYMDVSLISSEKQISLLKKIFKTRSKHNPAYAIYVYEFKNKIISMFDYHVVKVICDGLYGIYLSEQYACPKHPRLQEFLKNKGLEGKARLNIWPHPFP